VAAACWQAAHPHRKYEVLNNEENPMPIHTNKRDKLAPQEQMQVVRKQSVAKRYHRGTAAMFAAHVMLLIASLFVHPLYESTPANGSLS
jgi:hypothetical protein